MNITIPELSLVVLIGPSGCGKSSFAREHFKSTEVLSSDFCRGLVSDDENSQEATNDAFEVLHYVARKRLAAGNPALVEATNLQPEARKPLVTLAGEFHVLPVAIVLNLPEKVCHERNQSRPDRQFGPHVIRNQSQQLRRSLRGLEREGFRHVFVLSSPEEVSSVTIVRQPLWNNLKHEHGPFDIIGDVQLTHGLADSVEQLDKETPEFKQTVIEFLDDLVSHYVFDAGKLVVAHAGMREEMQGRGSGKVRDFALYGETTGETDEYGLPVRYNWATEYRGRAMVVYGHTPVAEPEWLNRTINIDTGCVFGGKLTALRYPERELISVPALRTYYESAKRFLAPTEAAPALSAQQQQDDLLDLEDVLGKRLIHTRLHRNITIREENATTALEVMSRFAANPKWLIYLPPTMSPCATSKRDGLLEHPEEAFSYYFHEGVHKVVCEQKHMGSRAVVVVCRDADAARKRFGIMEGEAGVCYTRTGRRFFNDAPLESEFLEKVRKAVEAAGIWEELKTDWVCLDCEWMPWSAKAQELLRQQYAPTGAAARAALPAAITALRAAAENPEIAALAEQHQLRKEATDLYIEAYRQYCWTVGSLADLKLAPFHLLASEGAVHTAKDHLWHMETLARICQADTGLLLATPFQVVDLTDRADQDKGIKWWEEL